jgi:hypothetical protein
MAVAGKKRLMNDIQGMDEGFKEVLMPYSTNREAVLIAIKEIARAGL